MKMTDLNISPNFFQILQEAQIKPSTYKLAMYLPELIQSSSGEPISFQTVTQLSPGTLRRAITELEMLYIICPTGRKSTYYFYNPHLFWVDTPLLKIERQSWNHMVELRIQEF